MHDLAWNNIKSQSAKCFKKKTLYINMHITYCNWEELLGSSSPLCWQELWARMSLDAMQSHPLQLQPNPDSPFRRVHSTPDDHRCRGPVAIKHSQRKYIGKGCMWKKYKYGSTGISIHSAYIYIYIINTLKHIQYIYIYIKTLLTKKLYMVNLLVWVCVGIWDRNFCQCDGVMCSKSGMHIPSISPCDTWVSACVFEHLFVGNSIWSLLQGIQGCQTFAC